MVNLLLLATAICTASVVTANRHHLDSSESAGRRLVALLQSQSNTFPSSSSINAVRPPYPGTPSSHHTKQAAGAPEAPPAPAAGAPPAPDSAGAPPASPEAPPTSAPSGQCGGASSYKYAGCIKEPEPYAMENRILAEKLIVSGATPQTCEAAAKAKGYAYFGTQWKGECWGAALPAVSFESRMTVSTECSMRCTSDLSQNCGGDWRLDAYFNAEMGGSVTAASAPPAGGAEGGAPPEGGDEAGAPPAGGAGAGAPPAGGAGGGAPPAGGAGAGAPPPPAGGPAVDPAGGPTAPE
ncbi:hypothetical protein BC829DRAFT_440928 [Chytridium lagenaria]|nr:hypothetical protein BC829DRAFT_440928 [Chytridium lagenaria]